jgi:hypothetical protein
MECMIIPVITGMYDHSSNNWNMEFMIIPIIPGTWSV